MWTIQYIFDNKVDYDYDKIKDYLSSKEGSIINTKQCSSLVVFYKNHAQTLTTKVDEEKEEPVKDNGDEVKKMDSDRILKRKRKPRNMSRCKCAIL